MPEGDTVWLAAKRMHDALAGRPLTRSDFRVPRLATADLSGRRVLEVLPRGKHMLTRVEGGLTVHTHFEMDGSWHLWPAGSRWTGAGPAWQIRVVLSNAETDAVGFRIPVVDLGPTDGEDEWVGHLGPDMLDDAYDGDEALRRLVADPSREVGEALLDQRIACGPGNLYRTEALYLTGTWPWTPVGDLPDPAGLLRRERALMLHNRGRSQQTTTGSLRRGELHWVFQRAGQPCRRCGSAIRASEQGRPGQQRHTVWCPVCQPACPPTAR